MVNKCGIKRVSPKIKQRRDGVWRCTDVVKTKGRRKRVRRVGGIVGLRN